MFAAGAGVPADASDYVRGCELWLRKRLGISLSEVHVLESLPRFLLARLSWLGSSMLFVVGHAPSSDHDEAEVAEWWAAAPRSLGRVRRR